MEERQPVSGMATVRDRDAEVCQDNGIVGFHPFGAAKGALRHIALTCSHCAPGEAKVRVDAWQMFIDGCAKVRDGVPALAAGDEHVSEPHVRLRIVRILFQNLPQRTLERRAVQFP